MKPAAYLDAVSNLVAGLDRARRDAIMNDLREAFAAGVTPEDLGDPDEYARLVIDDEDPDPNEPQGEIGGVPFETRGPTNASVRARIWAPQDPRILVPRLFGLGWTINLGAIAVKTGLLRQDDWDDTSIDRVPRPLLMALRVAPTAAAALAVAAAFAAARSGKPVPRHWDSRGKADAWGGPGWAWLPAGIAAASAAWGALPSTGDDQMIRPAVGAYGATLGAVIGVAAARGTGDPGARMPLAAVLGAPLGALVAMIAIPVSVAVRDEWNDVKK